jgi:hypothetical protein
MATERRPIPLRPDPDLLRADTLTSLARAIIAKATACLGQMRERDEPAILRARFPNDQAAITVLRAVSSPLTTTATTALLQTVVADIVASIGPIGAGARLLQSCLVLSLNHALRGTFLHVRRADACRHSVWEIGARQLVMQGVRG